MKRNGPVKKIIIALMTVILSSAFIAGSSYAVFSDTRDDSGSLFISGTPDLKVTENPSDPAMLGVNSMEHEDNRTTTYKLTNLGTADGNHLTVDLVNLVDSPGFTPEPEPIPDLGELSAHMNVVLWADNGASGGIAGDGIINGTEDTLYSGKLNLEAGPYSVANGLRAGATAYISVHCSIPSDAGNEIQGDSCSFNTEFVLTQ